LTPPDSLISHSFYIFSLFFYLFSKKAKASPLGCQVSALGHSGLFSFSPVFRAVLRQRRNRLGAVIYNYAHGHKTYGGFFMKKSKLFLTAMAALIAVIFSVLAGCASAGTGAATADATAAEKLAADINAIQAGSAAVNDSTVKLTGRVEIKTGLTVPEGVTLDLTAEGAEIKLQDGAVLTVNGTVNATGHGDHGKGWVGGHCQKETRAGFHPGT
jgi:hypothetical protein